MNSQQSTLSFERKAVIALSGCLSEYLNGEMKNHGLEPVRWDLTTVKYGALRAASGMVPRRFAASQIRDIVAAYAAAFESTMSEDTMSYGVVVATSFEFADISLEVWGVIDDQQEHGEGL